VNERGVADDRPHASIGEVLALLREEFPDVTISKIRFLESQGLIDPERTPSGYRKFYEADVERLRWILRQQRENYLPLKVIKGRLVGEPSASAGGAAPSGPGHGPALADAASSARVLTGTAPSGTSLTIDELGAASGLSPDDLTQLERFGLISGRSVGGTTYYDEQAAGVANLAAGFMRFGVEARHLRMYRTAAEREAGFLEQVVMPMLKQRNPEARRQAIDTLDELARLGQGLRAAMLRQALREYLEG
jgi:DNA-binding transcriptional MerR regulator